MCAKGNTVTSKVGATVILRALLKYPIDVDALPEGDVAANQFERVLPVSEAVREAPGVEEASFPHRVDNEDEIDNLVKKEPSEYF